MRALITGITGQDGYYLGKLLRSKGYEVFGLVNGPGNAKRDALQTELPGVTLIEGDVTLAATLLRALEISEPDEIYNLAAISFVSPSWTDAGRTFAVTAEGTFNLLESIRSWAGGGLRRIRYYQASTSEIFGRVDESPQTESTTLRPRSPYGVAKVFAHHCTINYRDTYGLHATNGILFNHESPRRGTEFVTRKITQAVARISFGLQDTLELGSLDARRDWGFAGDYVDAMWRMLQQDDPGDYVVATGATHSIRDVLDRAFREIGIDDWSSFVTLNPSFARPAETGQLVGDASKARVELGWEPSVGFDELIGMMVQADLAEQRALHDSVASRFG